jgi:ABC-type lipoprotein release transport system permease subunit
MTISDHNIIETVIEVEDSNKADKMKEYYSKQLKMYKWYERKRRDFEQRRDGQSTEIFLLAVEYFVYR